MGNHHFWRGNTPIFYERGRHCPRFLIGFAQICARQARAGDPGGPDDAIPMAYLDMACRMGLCLSGYPKGRGSFSRVRKTEISLVALRFPGRARVSTLSIWLWLNNMYRNGTLGKWNQRLYPAVCPGSVILSHTHLSFQSLCVPPSLAESIRYFFGVCSGE